MYAYHNKLYKTQNLRIVFYYITLSITLLEKLQSRQIASKRDSSQYADIIYYVKGKKYIVFTLATQFFFFFPHFEDFCMSL